MSHFSLPEFALDCFHARGRRELKEAITHFHILFGFVNRNSVEAPSTSINTMRAN